MCEKHAANSAGEEWVRNSVKVLTSDDPGDWFVLYKSVVFCFESWQTYNTATSSNVKDYLKPL